MKNIFSKSKHFKEEYCISIVQIGEIAPIEGSDFLATTLVNGVQIVIRKDQVCQGDTLFYASNECELNGKFLSANNLYDVGNWEMNSNHEEVASLKEKLSKLNESVNKTIDEIEREKIRTEADECAALIKSKCGYFNQYGRVRTIRLKGKQSFGYLFSLGELAKAYPEVSNINLEEYIGTDFDVINGEEDDVFVKAYVPRRKNVEHAKGMGREGKRQKKVERFDRLVNSNFVFHYDTSMLAKNMHNFSPDDVVTISSKIHGTSVIIANLKVRQPKKITIYKRFINSICKMFKKEKRYVDYDVVYGPIYSSRGVIKNKYINKDVSEGFYSYDLGSDYGDFLYPYLDEGMTVYGEIVGYTKNGTAIQKGYDYGCGVGQSYIMPYRITTLNEDGTKKEWNVTDVYEWTVNKINEHQELSLRMKPITIFYHGTLGDLYPNISRTEHWHENVLEALKAEKKFNMEKNEPLCKNKVPAEGIVIRKDDDEMAEAWKLKCNKFYEREAKEVDSGEVSVEMEFYVEEGDNNA